MYSVIIMTRSFSFCFVFGWFVLIEFFEFLFLAKPNHLFIHPSILQNINSHCAENGLVSIPPRGGKGGEEGVERITRERFLHFNVLNDLFLMYLLIANILRTFGN